MAETKKVATPVAEVPQVDVFAQFMTGDVVEERSREDIIRDMLASGRARRLNALKVRNTVEGIHNGNPFVTFVVDGYVIGDIRTGEEDAFGQPIMGLGKTHNVVASKYVVCGVMKDNPKLAIFAQDFLDDIVKGVELFAGAEVDVVMEYVPANTEYKNPFSSNSEAKVWDRDRMIHHIVRLTLGEVGQDKYLARISR